MKEKPKRFAISLGASFLKSVDEWRRKQRDRPSRAVAIRRLAECGLADSTIPHQRNERSRRKAVDMADQEIDRLGDEAVNNEERARRKRRLIQGPQEFREMRADWRKTKG